MAPPDRTYRPERPAALFGPPGEAHPDAWPGLTSTGPLGPAGVWPPPRPEQQWASRPSDDPPTVPLLLSSARLEGHREPGPPPGGRLPALLRRIVPPTWRGARVLPGRRGAMALVVVAAGAAVVAAIGVWTERPRAEPVTALPAVAVVTEPTASPVAVSAPTASAPAAPLVVSVSGRVRRPGLVEVLDGARVADVLEAAGGALPGTDLTGLNLARKVGDGEQVAVGVPAAPDAAAAGPVGNPAAGPSAPAGRLNLNTATAAELDILPGVGPVMVTRILEWRSRNSRFARVEQLREIEGIGERRFAQLRELVRV